MSDNEIVMYGAEWCPDCQRAKAFLEENGIEFQYRDTELEEDAVDTVEELTGGQRVIPTFQILGRTYINPDNPTLAGLLGTNPQGRVVLYGADWCPDCRRAKSFLHDNGINFQYVDVDEHEWATEVVESINEGMRTIPTILIDGTPFTNPDNPTLKEALRIEQEATSTRYDVLIIGAGAAGLTAAIYLQRAQHQTAILEGRNIGGNTFLTAQIENYPGFSNISGPELMDRMAEQATSYGAAINQGVEVQEIEKKEGFFRVTTGMGDYEGRAVIVSVGSQYKTLGIPGEEDLVGRGVHFCATCDAPFYKDQSILVIGGGNSAVEEGLYLTEFAERVIFVADRPEFTAQPILLEKLATIDNVTTLMNKTSREFAKNPDGSFRGLRIQDNDTGEEEVVEADGSFIFIGLTPNTSFLAGTVDLDAQGYVDVAPGSVETTTSGIFAAGDCRRGAIAQVAAATGEGVLASFAAVEYLKR